MKKVKVAIEEHLVKEIVVECPNTMSVNERMKFAEKKVRNLYRNGEIELTAENYSLTLHEVTDEETGLATEWTEW